MALEQRRLPEVDAIVLLRTGYGRFWPDRGRYMGTAELGDAVVPKLHFPGLHPDGAEWLVEKRGVRAVGLDTPSAARDAPVTALVRGEVPRDP